MGLVLAVTVIAVGVTGIVGVVGYLIDRSAERHEREEKD